MQIKNHFFASITLIACLTTTASAQRQTHLYIDDGNGNFTILSAPNGGTGAITFPGTSGTLIASGNLGTSGQVLTSNGLSAPTWQPAATSGVPSGAFIAFGSNAAQTGYTYTSITQSIAAASWSTKSSDLTAQHACAVLE